MERLRLPSGGDVAKRDAWCGDRSRLLDPAEPRRHSQRAQLEIQILEIPEESGPFGAKGVAEITAVATAPAIANAVYDAVKMRVTDLPITPEKLVRPQLQRSSILG